MLPTLSKSERGSVTAELAIAMPAVSLVLAVTLSGFALQIERMKLVDVAATSARAWARGEAEDKVRDIVRELINSGQEIDLEFRMLENLACVQVSKSVQIAGLGPSLFELSETQCGRKMGL